MLRFDVLTLFPDMIRHVADHSVLARAQQRGLFEVHVHDIRSSATDNHKTVDDTPYGGGAGMLLRVDIVAAALAVVPRVSERCAIVMTTPAGAPFVQGTANSWATDFDQIIILCGHYEGFDARIETLVTHQVSIGNFVLTGGELPALCMIDAVSRQIPGFLPDGAAHEESHSIIDPVSGEALLEYPHYTRPAEWNGLTVPEVLTSGNHAAIAAWRLEQARKKSTQTS
jgi:tRNA (guanine37-N1)-methyltransferase